MQLYCLQNFRWIWVGCVKAHFAACSPLFCRFHWMFVRLWTEYHEDCHNSINIMEDSNQGTTWNYRTEFVDLQNKHCAPLIIWLLQRDPSFKSVEINKFKHFFSEQVVSSVKNIVTKSFCSMHKSNKPLWHCKMLSFIAP